MVNYFQICGDGSGKVLETSLSNVGEVVLWDKNGQDSQLWYWDGPDGDVLRNKRFPQKVLDFDWLDFEKHQWGKVRLHTLNNGWNQKWHVKGPELACKGFQYDQIPNLRLDVIKGETGNGAIVGVYQRNGSSNQRWQLTANEDEEDENGKEVKEGKGGIKEEEEAADEEVDGKDGKAGNVKADLDVKVTITFKEEHGEEHNEEGDDVDLDEEEDDELCLGVKLLCNCFGTK